MGPYNQALSQTLAQLKKKKKKKPTAFLDGADALTLTFTINSQNYFVCYNHMGLMVYFYYCRQKPEKVLLAWLIISCIHFNSWFGNNCVTVGIIISCGFFGGFFWQYKNFIFLKGFIGYGLPDQTEFQALCL